MYRSAQIKKSGIIFKSKNLEVEYMNEITNIEKIIKDLSFSTVGLNSLQRLILLKEQDLKIQNIIKIASS